jgi:hypothetical protein
MRGLFLCDGHVIVMCFPPQINPIRGRARNGTYLHAEPRTHEREHARGAAGTHRHAPARMHAPGNSRVNWRRSAGRGADRVFGRARREEGVWGEFWGFLWGFFGGGGEME